MVFYLSCRPLRCRREMISPKECLKHNFPGIEYTWRCIGFDTKKDGRWLYEIRLDESYTAEQVAELRDVFVEGLAAFGAHLKTPTTAKELADKVTGLSFAIKGEAIKPPLEKEPAWCRQRRLKRESTISRSK